MLQPGGDNERKEEGDDKNCAGGFQVEPDGVTHGSLIGCDVDRTNPRLIQLDSTTDHDESLSRALPIRRRQRRENSGCSLSTITRKRLSFLRVDAGSLNARLNAHGGEDLSRS